MCLCSYVERNQKCIFENSDGPELWVQMDHLEKLKILRERRFVDDVDFLHF